MIALPWQELSTNQELHKGIEFGVKAAGEVSKDVGKHVAIVSRPGKTVSVSTRDSTLPDYGCVIENDWGFRHNQKGTVSYWRHRNPNEYK